MDSHSACTFGPRFARASPEYHPSTVGSFRGIHLVAIHCLFVVGHYSVETWKMQAKHREKLLFIDSHKKRMGECENSYKLVSYTEKSCNQTLALLVISGYNEKKLLLCG